ncbi:MAG: phosphotransferase enzyme family protein, partial [bacterium]
MIQKLLNLFESHFGEKVNQITPIKVHGSNRKRYRIFSKQGSVIGVENADRAENVAFLEFSRHFRKVGLPVPEIYVENLD